MLKTSSKAKRLAIKMPSVAEDRKIVAAAKLDPDAKPLTKARLAKMVPMKALRGRPKSENKKVLLSVRYSTEVVEYFKSTGDGWQSRMDNVLRAYVARKAARL
jgi:uncharacterized protein (DUF4415 family)